MSQPRASLSRAWGHQKAILQTPEIAPWQRASYACELGCKVQFLSGHLAFLPGIDALYTLQLYTSRPGLFEKMLGIVHCDSLNLFYLNLRKVACQLMGQTRRHTTQPGFQAHEKQCKT